MKKKQTRAIHVGANLWSGKEWITVQRRWRSAAYKARRAIRRGKVELTRGGAKGGLVAFNLRDRQTLMPGRDRWRLERQREIPAHTFGDVSNLSLDAKPEKPVLTLGTTSVVDGHQF